MVEDDDVVGLPNLVIASVSHVLVSDTGPATKSHNCDYLLLCHTDIITFFVRSQSCNYLSTNCNYLLLSHTDIITFFVRSHSCSYLSTKSHNCNYLWLCHTNIITFFIRSQSCNYLSSKSHNCNYLLPTHTDIIMSFLAGHTAVITCPPSLTTVIICASVTQT